MSRTAAPAPIHRLIRTLGPAALCMAAAGVPSSGAGAATPSRTDGRGTRPSRSPDADAIVAFEPNVGQTDGRVRFVGRSRDAVAFLTADGCTVRTRAGSFSLGYDSGTPRAEMRLRSVSRYARLAGSDGRMPDVPRFAQVRGPAAGGAEIVWRGDEGRLRFDVAFPPAPGAADRTAAFSLSVADADGARVGADGRLVIDDEGATHAFTAPVAWQDTPLGRRPVEARWVERGGGRFGFAVGAHDRTLPLIVDPTLEAGTWLGGAADDGTDTAIALDSAGDVVLAGQTLSTDFPAGRSGGGPSVHRTGKTDATSVYDAFVAKLAADGSARPWCTYLGGTGDDRAADVALTPDGDIWVCGATSATDFPTFSTPLSTTGSGFLTKLSADGSVLRASTYRTRAGRRVAIDSAGAAFLLSDGAPAQVIKHNAGLTGVTWTHTFTPATGSVTGRGLAVDASDHAWVAGFTSTNDSTMAIFGSLQTVYGGGSNDAILYRLDGTNAARNVSTYWGGSGDDQAEDVAIDSGGDVVICGSTTSTNMTVTGGAQTTHRGGTEGFALRVDPTAFFRRGSTWVGGNGTDVARSVATGPFGDVYVCGDTTSTTNFLLASAIQATHGGGTTDGFAVKLSSNLGTARYATYLGGSGADAVTGVAIGDAGRAKYAGRTASSAFPVVSPQFQTANGGGGDAFLAGVEESSAPFGDRSERTLAATSIGYPYSTALTVDGGAGTITYGLASGALPPGLSLASSGSVTGTPTASGTFRFTAKVQDAEFAAMRQPYVLVVNAAPVITTAALPPATVGEAYLGRLSVGGGTPGYTWHLLSAADTIPGGAVFSSDGSLGGTLTTVGDFTFSADVYDSVGANSSRSVTLRVNPRPAVTDRAIPQCTEGRPYSVTFAATLGTPPYVWSLAPGPTPLAAGGIGASSGVLAGTAAGAGTYDFTVRITDSNGAVETRTFRSIVNPFPAIGSPELPFAVSDRPYAASFVTTGGTGSPRWSVTDGDVPAGFFLHEDTGRLDGTAGLARTFDFTVRSVDDCGAAATADATLVVVDVLSLDAKKNVAEHAFDPDSADPLRRAVELLEGTELSAVLSVTGGGTLGADLSLLDGGGRDIDVSGFLRADRKDRKVELRRFPVPATGRYFLVAAPEPGFVGSVTLGASASAEGGRSGTVPVSTSGDAAEVAVPALPGARLKFTAKKPKGGAAVPAIVSVLDADGNELLVPEDLKPSKSGATLTVRTPLPGSVRILLAAADGSPAGDVAWTWTLRNPKSYELRLFDLVAGEE